MSNPRLPLRYLIPTYLAYLIIVLPFRQHLGIEPWSWEGFAMSTLTFGWLAFLFIPHGAPPNE